jgi:hypothetical protein
MVIGHGPDQDTIAQIKTRIRGYLPEIELGTHILEFDRKVGKGHLARKLISKGKVPAFGSVNRKVVTHFKSGIEKGKPLNMVPVAMGDENVSPDAASALKQFLAEMVDP